MIASVSSQILRPFSEEQWEVIAEAKDRALSTPHNELLPENFPEVRPQILLSWKRSMMAGVDPTASEIPIENDYNPEASWVKISEPIMDRLSVQVASFGGWAFLTDQYSRLVKVVHNKHSDFPDLVGAKMIPGQCFSEERIGTNGIGISQELHMPFLVSGTEHFRAPTTITTTGVPIVDPTTRRTLGTLGIHCRREYASVSLLPLVTELGRSIENQLLLEKPDSDRELFQAFTDVRRRFPGPLIAVSHDLMLSTATARQLYGPADGPLIESIAREAATQSHETRVIRTLSNGKNVEFRSIPTPQPGGGFAALLLMQEKRQGETGPPTKNSTATIDQAVQKAVKAADKVLLTGERGTGKHWMANTVLQGITGLVNAIDCATEFWVGSDNLSEIAQAFDNNTHPILLLHIDETPTGAREILGTLIRKTRSVVIATCTEGSKEDPEYSHLMESFNAVVRIPPLRERIADIPDMCEKILSHFADKTGSDFVDGPKRYLSTKALGALLGHDWPGNVRQLKQVLYTAAIRALGAQIQEEDLPPAYRTSAAGGNLTLMERLERQALLSVLNSCGGNRNTAAARLGISRATMYRKLRRYQLS